MTFEYFLCWKVGITERYWVNICFFQLKTCKLLFHQVWLTLILTVRLFSILSDNDLWIFLCWKVGITERYWVNVCIFQLKTCKIVFPQIWLTLFLTVHLFSILSDNDLWIFSVLESGYYQKILSKYLFFSVKNLQACVSSSLINF